MSEGSSSASAAEVALAGALKSLPNPDMPVGASANEQAMTTIADVQHHAVCDLPSKRGSLSRDESTLQRTRARSGPYRFASHAAWALIGTIFAAACRQGADFASTKEAATAWGVLIGVAASCAWLAMDESEVDVEEHCEREASWMNMNATESKSCKQD